MLQVLSEKQDMTYLSWSKVRHSSGTAGSFLKAYSDLGEKRTYYKLSNYDAYHGIIGHECINELIVDRLLTILGIDHLSYQLIHSDVLIDEKIHDTWICASENFKQPGENKIALDIYYQTEREKNENPLEFCIRCGWEDYIYEMLVVDYIILNRDRHGANIEVLRNSKKRTLRLAPLFDHGLSLIFNCRDAASAAASEVLEDKPVQCFVGSHSTWENLTLIPPEKLPVLRPLQESDRSALFVDLDAALPKVWQDKIWEMLWERWCRYEDFCHSRR